MNLTFSHVSFIIRIQKIVRQFETHNFDLQGKTLTDADLEERIKSIFSQCDLNTDGKITEEEFVKAGATIAEMFELEAAEDEQD